MKRALVRGAAIVAGCALLVVSLPAVSQAAPGLERANKKVTRDVVKDVDRSVPVKCRTVYRAKSSARWTVLFVKSPVTNACTAYAVDGYAVVRKSKGTWNPVVSTSSISCKKLNKQLKRAGAPSSVRKDLRSESAGLCERR